MRILAIVPLVAACSGERSVFVERTWDQRLTAVVTLSGAGPREPLVMDASLSLEVPDGDDLRLTVDLYDDDVDVRGCGVTLAGDGPLLPNPKARHEGALDGERVTLAEVANPQNTTLRFVDCEPVPSLCERVTVETTQLEAYPNHDILAAVGLDDTTALVGGQFGLIGQLRGQTVSQIDGLDDQPIRALVRGGDGLYYGRTGSRIFAVDDTSLVFFEPVLNADIAAFGDGILVLATDGRILERTASSSASIERTGELPSNVLSMHGGGGELFVVNAAGIHRKDGDAWSLERNLDQLTEVPVISGAGPFVLLSSIVLLRDTAWTPIEYPFQSVNAIALDVNAAGLMIAGGETGALALYDGATWCSVSGGTLVDYRAVTFSPGGRTGWAFSNSNGNGPPVATRILFP